VAAQAWKAWQPKEGSQRGRQVPGSHAAVSVHGSDEYAIKHAFEALQREHPDFQFFQAALLFSLACWPSVLLPSDGVLGEISV
jgi:hypothetical protein